MNDFNKNAVRDEGTRDVDQTSDGTESNLLTAARRIGLQPTVAYIPSMTSESPQERERRHKRERAQRRRADEQAQGLQQLNFSKVPTEKADEIKEAVAAILDGRNAPTPAPVPNTAPAVRRMSVRTWLLLAGVVLLSFAVGASMGL